jgi:hypothetical protein
LLDIHWRWGYDHGGRRYRHADRQPHVDVDVGFGVYLGFCRDKSRKSENSHGCKDSRFQLVLLSIFPFTNFLILSAKPDEIFIWINRSERLTCPPALPQIDEWNFTESRTGCKSRANNCIFQGVKGCADGVFG